jgi:uncharacterized protein YcfJ
MTRQLIVGTIIGAVAVTAIGGIAGFKLLDTDYADVIDVQPIAPTTEQCRDEVVTQQKPVKDPKQVTGTVAGAVIGGVLGSKVGDGSGQDIATVGGAVAGGYAGNKIQEKIQEGNVEQKVHRVCEVVPDEQAAPVAYNVTYVYEGTEHTVRLDDDPGDRISVNENGLPEDRD